MNKFLSPPSSAALRCERRQPGLLGGGHQTFPSGSASSFYMSLAPFAGTYETNDYNAALYLVYQLSSPDEQMSPDTYKSKALLLYKLIQNLKYATDVSVEALKALQEAAANIPGIGSLMFSGGNLPGTIASAAGVAMSASKAQKVTDLLDMTSSQKAKLHEWANSRGSPGAQSASRTFKGSINIISKNNKLFFEIPITAVGQHYKILGEVHNSVAHLPLTNTKAALNQLAHLHEGGATGALKMLGGKTAGGILAVGPQALLDVSDSSTPKEFYNKSVYSQPTNIASAAAGMAGGAFVTVAFTAASLGAAPLTLVLLVGWGAGLGVQALIVNKGWDKDLGDMLKL